MSMLALMTCVTMTCKISNEKSLIATRELLSIHDGCNQRHQKYKHKPDPPTNYNFKSPNLNRFLGPLLKNRKSKPSETLLLKKARSLNTFNCLNLP